ncbi:MAG TPA: nicotinate-nucleotide adenylyltransferase [Chloroflexi bacterium]|jgi:nicotinate-nucleotide adenylyltransferase|nr:nicotinate-nucleotide adenylyltransferase [Chloroflexota bacterium]
MALETQPSPSKAAEQTAGTCRLGVYGGTFDPIHIGHLIIAEEARARLGLDSILFVPARVSPLKLPGTCFSVEDRLRMVDLAVRDNPHFCVSRVDVDRPGPSYTADTLRALQEAYPDAELYFIMGADSLESLHRWYRPEEIIHRARLVVVSRPGHAIELDALEAKLPGISDVVEPLTTLDIGISSTDIRRRLQVGLPIRYQVPDVVEAYIREHPPQRPFEATEDKEHDSHPSCSPCDATESAGSCV